MNPPGQPKFWRSLDAATHSRAEFPELAPGVGDTVSRRGFLKFLGASAALASLSGCTREPIHPIVPYVTQPEELVPGRPLHYATVMPLGGFATGLMVESHEGHPTKIEGNPRHLASLGATGIFQQAALLDLYDPDRSQSVLNAGEVSDYGNFQAALITALRGQRANRGAGLRILTRSLTSPTLIAQLEELLRQFPEAHWHQYQPLARDNSLEGARLAFGQPWETRHHLDRARIVVSLDADFLFDHPAALKLTRQFSDQRNPEGEMIRLYVAEPTPSITGSAADHRIPAAAREVQELARTLAGRGDVSKLAPTQQRWARAVNEDLRAHRGASVVMVGEAQPPWLHVLAHQMNEQLGNIGRTVEYAPSAEKHWIHHGHSLRDLTSAMQQNQVECLLILGGNPAYDAPADVPFENELRRVPFSVHLGPAQNETTAACRWHVPESHFLESWNDARAFDGTTSIGQPLIAPIYATKSAHELLHYLLHEQNYTDYDVVRDHWRGQWTEGDFEKRWREALHEGVIPGTEIAATSVKLIPSEPISEPPTASGLLEILFRPDPCVWDGAFANNSWLQELPKPFSKVTWDNPALISPAWAQQMNLVSGDMVRVTVNGRSLELPVIITPGQASHSITVHLGYGRKVAGRVGKQIGANAFSLRTAPIAGGEIVKLDRRIKLAVMTQHHQVEGRDLIRATTLGEFQNDRHAAGKGRETTPAETDTLYNTGEFKYTDYAWGMTIDLNRCIGCNACAIACQSENNIPVVGKEQVASGRDMAWIRIDQYFEGNAEAPRIYNQPVPCMQCENAPCELVCPVGATVHDHEGLNLQVYNRCVGTRYCSNNCPYKVRRFNFYRYADYETASLKPMRNPDVTVRWRGVMEKCTYCIQRINENRINAQLGNRSIQDGEIQTACQQVCPARAITFGNINDPGSAVSKLKASPLNYSMLGELNTRPRTTYLARVRNPHPGLEENA